MLKSANFHKHGIPRRSYSLAILRKQDAAWIGWIGFGKADDPSIGDIEFGYAIHKKNYNMIKDEWAEKYPR